LKTDLMGTYQKRNVQTAAKTLEILKQLGFGISPEAVERGLQHVVSNTGLKGRYQVLREQPKVICDTAHNREGLELVLKQVLREEYQGLIKLLTEAHIMYDVLEPASLGSGRNPRDLSGYELLILGDLRNMNREFTDMIQ